MDQLNRYREVIRRELEAFVASVKRPDDPLRYEVVHDPILDHFELVESG